jgi:hypothetical protein
MTSLLHGASTQDALSKDESIPVPRAPIPTAVEDFLATMPGAYHDRFNEVDARIHAAIVLRRQGASVHLEMYDDPVKGHVLCVVTNHLPGLMRMVSAVLAAHSLNILEKTFYCRTPLRAWREAVSFFQVAPMNDGTELNDELVASLRNTIVDVLKGKVDIASLSRRASPTWRPPPPPLESIPEPEPSSVNIDRLSQLHMTEPPPAPPPVRFSNVPPLAAE